MKIHKDIIQGSDEWKALRVGKMTGSFAQQIGNSGRGLDTYILQVMAEKYANVQEEQYTNSHMERGQELEETARVMYELENNVTVEQVGGVSGGKYVWVSPDGLIEPDGGIEIKCHNNTKHFDIILNGLKAVDTKYIWQVQMNLLVTGRKWWLLVCYNPSFKQSLVTFRVEPDKEKHEKLKEGIEEGIKKIKMFEKQYNKLTNGN